MAIWGLIGLALVAGTILGWALLRYLIACAEREELMTERLPLAASRRASTGLATSVVIPAAFLGAQGLDHIGHTGF